MSGNMVRRLADGVARTPPLRSLLFKVTKPRRFLVLCYHRVNESGHPFFGGTPTALFRRQMEVLRDAFDVFFLHELVERAMRGDVPDNAVAITFDDANDASSDPLALKRVGMWGDDPYLSALRTARSRLGS